MPDAVWPEESARVHASAAGIVRRVTRLRPGPAQSPLTCACPSSPMTWPSVATPTETPTATSWRSAPTIFFGWTTTPRITLTGIGSPGHRFVAPLPSKGYNIGLAVSRRSERPFALALSDVTQQLSVIDLVGDAAGSKKLAAMPDTPRAADLRDGDSPASHANWAAPSSPRGSGVWSFKRASLEPFVRRLPSGWLE